MFVGRQYRVSGVSGNATASNVFVLRALTGAEWTIRDVSSNKEGSLSMLSSDFEPWRSEGVEIRLSMLARSCA